MRWPEGPPHLTLKPSKKTHKKKKQEKKKQLKKHKNTPKRAFQLSVKFFLFWCVFQKFPFFDTLTQKACTPKHYKNRGFSEFFWKELCVTKGPFLDKKKPNSWIPVIIFWPFSSLSTIENTQFCWNPYFYSVFDKQPFQKNKRGPVSNH